MLSFSDNETFQNSHVSWGVLLGLVAGFTYALYSWSARQLVLKEISNKEAMDAIFGCGGLLLIPVMIITGSNFLTSWNNIMVGSYMAFIPMFLGWFWIIKSICQYCYHYHAFRICCIDNSSHIIIFN